MPAKNGYKQACFYCTEEFEPSAKWQIFCGNSCKTIWNRLNVDSCFYCGDIATDRDHILPAASRGHRAFNGQETVRCCRECNVVLGANNFSNIFDRIDFLIRRYITRYKLHKVAPIWDKDELKEMGYSMRTKIKKEQSTRIKGENKVVFLRARKLELIGEFDEDE